MTTDYFDKNMIGNMIIATAVSGLVTMFGNKLANLFDDLQYYINWLYIKMFYRNESKINIVGTIKLSTYGVRTNFPQSYRAIMSLVVKKKLNLFDITVLEHSDRSDDYGRRYEQLKDYNFFVNTNKKIMIDDNIYASFFEHSEDTGGKEHTACKIRFLTTQISSNKYNTNELREKIIEWTRIYTDETQNYVDDGKIYYYNLRMKHEKQTVPLKNNDDDYSDYDDDYDDDEIKWHKHVLKTFKTFDNIFFKDKQPLLNKINYFLNNEEVYKRKGIPYNLGLLFHGTPGCGKTSCIKAISNYTGRHVVEINLNRVKTCTEFVSIFNDMMMNDSYVPHDKKIIVLEDIDCMIDIIKSRKNMNKIDDNLQNDIDDIKMIKMLMMNKYKKNKNFEPTDKLTLSCILNTIDGVLENYGRILIITTNYVDLLDEALIRPGRVDAKIEFTKCDRTMYQDIIENYYDTKIQDDVPFIENSHSPAEVLEICSMYNDVDDAIKKLITRQEDIQRVIEDKINKLINSISTGGDDANHENPNPENNPSDVNKLNKNHEQEHEQEQENDQNPNLTKNLSVNTPTDSNLSNDSNLSGDSNLSNDPNLSDDSNLSDAPKLSKHDNKNFDEFDEFIDDTDDTDNTNAEDENDDEDEEEDEDEDKDYNKNKKSNKMNKKSNELKKTNKLVKKSIKKIKVR